MLSPGRVLHNRYLVTSLIGQGGMGAVYQAKDERLGSTVALKESHLRDEFLQQAFEREARLLANLRHPGLPKVIDYFDDSENQYLVMEFIPGDDLGTLLRESGEPFSPSKVLGWACQLLDILQYLHSNQILHRDIKPQNLKLTNDNQIILLDFGLAKGSIAQMQFNTNVSVFGYTPAYASVEQVQGKGTDARSDLYSLAATLYQLITGELAPNAMERGSAVLSRETDPLRSPIESNPEIPRPLASAIIRSLALNKNDRHASAAEMAREIGCNGTGVPIDSKESKPSKSKSKDAQKPKLVGTPTQTKVKSRAKPKPVERKPAREPIKEQSPSVANSAGSSVVALRRLKDLSPPTGFFDRQAMGKTIFFEADSVRFSKIEETFRFYRDHLNVEFQALSKQANITFGLWVLCVSLGFCILLSGLLMMFFGRITEGSVTSASTILVYFIQRVFQQREDHYRKLVSKKRRHLEYGNQWLLAIQSIDAMSDHEDRMKRQARLVDVLTDKLQQVTKLENKRDKDSTDRGKLAIKNKSRKATPKARRKHV